MSKYIIRRKATEDIEQIWLYTYFHWSENQADKYYCLLIEKIEFIARNVNIGRDIDYIKEGYRCYPVESHIIFYKISDNETITVIRILHQNMDIPNRLKDL
jgi:toxin ParE1/3/4